MVLKAARAGVPVTVAMRGALYSGIFVARKTNLTLIAHVHRSSIEIYTYPDRISIGPSPTVKVSFDVSGLTRSGQSSHLRSDKTLDLRHLLCHDLLQELTRTVKTIEIGESIEVIAADPLTLVDIPARASRERLQIVSTQDDWLAIRFCVKRLT